MAVSSTWSIGGPVSSAIVNFRVVAVLIVGFWGFGSIGLFGTTVSSTLAVHLIK